jgi:biotin operon repressor
LNLLYKQPQVSVQFVAKTLNLSAPAARKAINNLEKLGILAEVSGRKRNRRHRYQSYVQIIEEGTDYNIVWPYLENHVGLTKHDQVVIFIYNSKFKGIDGESTFQLNVAASRGGCKPGTSSLDPKITPELRTERVIQ